MPLPHTHPSVTCYKVHKCRCDECRELANQAAREHRQRKRQREITGTPFALPPDEIIRLRRLVGLPPEGPPPERRGRPRKQRNGVK